MINYTKKYAENYVHSSYCKCLWVDSLLFFSNLIISHQQHMPGPLAEPVCSVVEDPSPTTFLRSWASSSCWWLMEMKEWVR